MSSNPEIFDVKGAFCYEILQVAKNISLGLLLQKPVTRCIAMDQYAAVIVAVYEDLQAARGSARHCGTKNELHCNCTQCLATILVTGGV